MTYAQKFEHYGRKTLPLSSGIVSPMGNDDLRAIVKRNLLFFMERPQALYKNPNALAIKAGLAANSIRNLLNPKQRPVTRDKPDGYPTLDTLEAIAKAIPCPVWQLLHPDVEKALREEELYKRIRLEYDALPKSSEETVN